MMAVNEVQNPPIEENTIEGLMLHLKKIWDEVGESQEERDKMLLQIEQECLDVYKRKVKHAENSKKQLLKSLSDAKLNLSTSLSDLGEKDPAAIHHKISGTIKDQLADVAQQLVGLWEQKEERIKRKHFSDVQSQIQEIRREIAGSVNLNDVPAVDESDLTLKKLEEYQSELLKLKKEKSDRLLKETAFEKQSNLEKIFADSHIEIDSDAAREKIVALIDSGDIEQIELLADMDNQIEIASEEASSRKDILNKLEEWMSACEESWLLDYYNNTIKHHYVFTGARLNIEETAKILMDEISAWEETHKKSFKYESVPLLALLKSEGGEEEKQRIWAVQRLKGYLPEFTPSKANQDFPFVQIKDFSEEDAVLDKAKRVLAMVESEQPFCLFSVHGPVWYSMHADRFVLLPNPIKVENGSLISMRLAHVLRIVVQQLENGAFMNKRHVFYTDPDLFGNEQVYSDLTLKQVTVLMGHQLDSLQVHTNHRGSVVGDLKYTYENQEIDCNKTDRLGQALPSVVDRVTNVSSGAVFILLVESIAMLTTLHANNFEKTYKCIIVSGAGVPDMGSRRFLQKISSILELPVLCLTDGDVYGFNIFMNFKYGSAAMAFDGANLTCPNLHWLGIRPTDTIRYTIPEACMIPMEEREVVMVKNLLQESHVKKDWKDELYFMLDQKRKINIFAHSDVNWFAKQFVPAKIISRDWLI